MARTLLNGDRNGPDEHRYASWSRPITLELATTPADAAALERLAQLDSQALPAGPHLIARRDGAIAAALSLATGELIADPFQRTAELRELLRCHADGVRPTTKLTPRTGRARLRPAAATA
jgi:hypothetical protein